MGTLTVAQMESELRVHLGNRTSEDSRLIIALNLAQMRIARKHHWEELESSTTGTFAQTADQEADSMLDLSALNIRDLYSFRYTDGTSRAGKLIYKPVRQFDMQFPDVGIPSRNCPKIYTLYRLNQAQVYPSPDAAYDYTIRYLAWPTALVTGSASTSDLDEKDDALITLSASYLYHSLGKDDKASKFWGIYAAIMNECMDEQQEKPDMDILSPHESALLTGETGRGNYYTNPFIREDP